jgi:hypothetical protein
MLEKNRLRTRCNHKGYLMNNQGRGSKQLLPNQRLLQPMMLIHGELVEAVQCEDGKVGKQCLFTTIIHVHGQMRLDIQKQELKTNEWDITLQAKEVGVPGMDEVAVAFVKQHFAYFLDTNE